MSQNDCCGPWTHLFPVTTNWPVSTVVYHSLFNAAPTSWRMRDTRCGCQVQSPPQSPVAWPFWPFLLPVQPTKLECAQERSAPRLPPARREGLWRLIAQSDQRTPRASPHPVVESAHAGLGLALRGCLQLDDTGHQIFPCGKRNVPVPRSSLRTLVLRLLR